jgi:hypothetical protein
MGVIHKMSSSEKGLGDGNFLMKLDVAADIGFNIVNKGAVFLDVTL